MSANNVRPYFTWSSAGLINASLLPVLSQLLKCSNR